MVEIRNTWNWKTLLDLNQPIKEKFKLWKNYQIKFVQFVIDHLIGEKNGMIVGMKLNIAQIGVEKGSLKDESDIYNFPKSIIWT